MLTFRLEFYQLEKMALLLRFVDTKYLMMLITNIFKLSLFYDFKLMFMLYFITRFFFVAISNF